MLHNVAFTCTQLGERKADDYWRFPFCQHPLFFVSVQLYKVSAPRRRCDVGTFQIETSTILCENKNSLLCIMLSTLINLPWYALNCKRKARLFSQQNHQIFLHQIVTAYRELDKCGKRYNVQTMHVIWHWGGEMCYFKVVSGRKMAAALLIGMAVCAAGCLVFRAGNWVSVSAAQKELPIYSVERKDRKSVV